MEKADFYSLNWLVTLKIRSRSPKSNQLLLCHNDTIYQFWSDSIIRFKRYRAETKFCTFKRVIVTLKIRSRSPKSDHHFSPSKQYICASLVKVHSLVQKITSRNQATRMWKLIGSAPKTICPSPLQLGGQNCHPVTKYLPFCNDSKF